MDFYLQRLQDAIGSVTRVSAPNCSAAARRRRSGALPKSSSISTLLTPAPSKDLKSALWLENLWLAFAGGKIVTRTMVVVGCGYLPQGRKAPENAVPCGLTPEQVLAEITQKIVAMDAAISHAEQRFGSNVALLDHPILGPLRAQQWRKFHWVHGRHHLKQLRRLRQSLLEK